MKPKFTVQALVCLCLIFFSSSAFAQNTTITGKITDQTGNALTGASVQVKGTNTGTLTGTNGAFSLSVPASATTLVVSYIGYNDAEIAIGNKTTIDVALKSNTTTLNDVVIVSVGYGTLDKREVSSAITHLSSTDLTKVASNNPLMSMQGKVAGLSVTNTASADPNSSPSIQLRGVSSRDAGLGPLYVVNGVPGGNIDNINQNDIASIDVLKGGAASAIYGTRGSNGVIVITTKKGTTEPHLFYEGNLSFDYATNQLHVLSKEEFLAHERGVDMGGNTDWMKVVTRDPAIAQKHTLQLSGGNNHSNYFASVDYRKANGIDLRASKEEYGARISLNHTSASNLFEATLNIAPRYAKTNTADNSAFNYALTLNPTISPYDSAGRYAYITTGFFSNNPIEAAKTVLSQQEIKYLDISGSIRMNILPNLNTLVTLGEVSRSLKALGFTPSTNTSVINGTGRSKANQSLDDNDQKSFEWTGNYALTVKRHAIKLLAGYSYELFQAEGFNATNEDFPSDAFTYNNLGSGIWNIEEGINNTGSYKNSSKLIAFFGRLNYNYNEKYYMSASLRREGSTKFGIANKWGYFPAASVGWRMEQEDFLKDVSWVDGLKLRADYGVTGNQDFGNYLSLETYAGAGYYVFNGVTYQVWGPNQNANFDLRWEKAINFNVGLDFELFKGDITGSLNYFVRTNKDLLGNYNVPNPPNIQTQTYANVGTMKNSGLELQLNARVVKAKKFSYSISFTGATNDNKFVSFSNDTYIGQNYIDVVGMPAPGSPGNIQRLQEGQRIGSFYTLKSADYDDEGRLLVYNKEGKIIPANEATLDDRQFTGNGLPKFTGSLGNTFGYQKWDLSIFLRGAFGYQLFNTYAFYLGTSATQANANVLTSAFDGGKYSKLTNPATYSALSDYFLEQGNFVKISNATLGYTQPFSFKYLQSIRVYVSARNLYTFTKYTGGDPDLIQVNGLYPGVNNSLSYYPATIQILFGLQLNF